MPKTGRLLFTVSTDLTQGIRVGPDAFALGTFAQVVFSDHHCVQIRFAARAGCDFIRRNFRAIHFPAAMGTELCAEKNHSETGRARHRGQSRPAVTTLGRFARS
jgi:hypothetical protein